MRITYKLGRRKDFPQDVDDFVFTRIRQSGAPIPGMAVSQITLSLAAGYVNLALNDRDAFDTSRSYARFVHRIFHEGRTAEEKGAPERNRLPPFVQLERDVVKSLLVRPQIFGFRLGLMDRSGLYQRLPLATQLNIYDWIEPALRKQCEDSRFNFARCFPPPPGLERFRRSRPREPVPLGG